MLTLFLFFSVFLYLIWIRRKVYYLSSKLKNDLWNFPLLGNGYLFFGSDEDRMNSFQKLGYITLKYNGLSKVWFGPQFVLSVADPDYIAQLLKICNEKDEILRNIVFEVIGNSSIFAPVSIWRPRRKLIAPIFSQKKLNEFVTVFAKQSKTLVDRLKDVPKETDFELWKYIAAYSMDSVCETVLGVKVNSQKNTEEPFLTSFESICHEASLRVCQASIVQKIFKYLPHYKDFLKNISFIQEFVDKIINKKIQEIQENQNNLDVTDETKLTKSILDLYIDLSEEQSGFTKLELREETLGLVLAGTDTSAVAAAFTCLMMALHPDVQDKVYTELAEVLGDRPITAEDLPRLKYLEMVIKESLRLYPPVPVILRKAHRDIQLDNGLIIYKDTAILIHLWATHRNPSHWGSDAESFRPERFIDAVPKHPAAFVPFAFGPRTCLGYQYAMMSLKTLLSSIIREYRLLPETSFKRDSKIRLKFGIMMKDVNNFQIRIEPRV